jgi:hypothetical protein
MRVGEEGEGRLGGERCVVLCGRWPACIRGPRRAWTASSASANPFSRGTCTDWGFGAWRRGQCARQLRSVRFTLLQKWCKTLTTLVRPRRGSRTDEHLGRRHETHLLGKLSSLICLFRGCFPLIEHLLLLVLFRIRVASFALSQNAAEDRSKGAREPPKRSFVRGGCGWRTRERGRAHVRGRGGLLRALAFWGCVVLLVELLHHLVDLYVFPQLLWRRPNRV